MKPIYRSLIVAIYGAITLTGCTQELIETPSGVEVLPDGRLRIPIEFIFPEMNEVQTRSGATEPELALANILLFVFESDADALNEDAPLQQLITDENISLASNGRVTVTLAESDVPVRLRALTNLSSATVAYIKTRHIAGSTTAENYFDITDGIAGIYKGGTPGGEVDAIPMATGPLYLPGINEHTVLSNWELGFCCAKINFHVTTTNFSLQGATLLNGSERGYLREHTPLPINHNHAGATFGTVRYNEVVGTPPTIYLYENNGDNGNNPTDLIVKGYYNHAPVASYYKIRIRYTDAITHQECYDINRSTCYQVNITAVDSPGYPTAADAERNLPSNIQYDIIVDDGQSHDIISNGQYYMGFTNSEVRYYGLPDANPVTLTTVTLGAADGQTLPSTISVAASPATEIQVTSGASNTVSSGSTVDIKARLTKPDIDGTITITCGNLKKIIPVKTYKYAPTTASFISVDDVAYGEITYDPNSFIGLSATDESPSTDQSIDAGGSTVYLCTTHADMQRTAEAYFSLKKVEGGRLKVVVTQEYSTVQHDETNYDQENDDIERRANSYILPIPTNPIVYKISVKRVDDYWGNLWANEYITSGSIAAGKRIFGGATPDNTLVENEDWYPEIIWADFNVNVTSSSNPWTNIPTNGVTLTKTPKNNGVHDGLEIGLYGNFASTGINGGRGGNVIIGVKNTNDDILWSWHLWITDTSESYAFNFGTATGYKRTMDRNLGALGWLQPDGVYTYGLYYQWGRKDPFPTSSSSSENGTESRIYNASHPSGTTFAGGIGAKTAAGSTSTVALSIANPTTFYHNSTGDWIGKTNDGAYQKRSRWIFISSDAAGTSTRTATYDAKGMKTIFDPCPYGWRVPWGNNWSNLSTPDGPNVFPWNTNTVRGRTFTGGYFFPASGSRNNSSGNLGNINTFGYYWSGSPPSSTESYNLTIWNGNINPNSVAARADGFPIRPVKDE